MTKLTDYEARQVEEIARWKSERPSLLLASYRGLSRPLRRLISHTVPKNFVGAILDEVEARAVTNDRVKDILAAAGVKSVRALRKQPMEVCDRLAATVSARAEHAALLEGVLPALGSIAIPGLGGVAAAVFDVPVLFEGSLLAIRRIGHCYGFPLDKKADRQFVLAALDLANVEAPRLGGDEAAAFRRLDGSGRPSDERPAAIDNLEDTVADDLPIDAVPFVGDVSPIVLDYAFVRRVDVTARRVFQERRLKEDGKVDGIPPSPTSRRRSSTEEVARVASEVTYAGAYGVAFGATFTAALTGSLASAMVPGPVRKGFRDGASDASRDARQFLEGFRQHESADPELAATAG